MNMRNVLKIGAAIAAIGFAAQAPAATLSCNLTDAMANGSTASQCAGIDNNGNPTWEASFINGQAWGGDFSFVDKTDEAGLSGWTLTVSDTDVAGYPYSYSLTVPSAWVGEVVDFVLLIKQGQNSFAYLFQNVTLGINGGFFSLAQLNSTNGAQGYSHVSAYIGEGTRVPEPTSLALLGLGLAGLGLARRRRS